MVAVHLMKSFCLGLLTLLYGGEIWHARAGDVRSASVAWNNGFRKIFNTCLRESVTPLQFSCSCLPLSFLIHQRRLLYWKKCLFSNNMIIQTLARSCIDNIGALSDIYNFIAKDLGDLPAYHLKCLIWDVFSCML